MGKSKKQQEAEVEKTAPDPTTGDVPEEVGEDIVLTPMQRLIREGELPSYDEFVALTKDRDQRAVIYAALLKAQKIATSSVV